jgi:hypothetical protein
MTDKTQAGPSAGKSPEHREPIESPGQDTKADRRLAQQALVRARLAVGDTYADAARAGGTSERSVSRWMSDSAFARSVSEARAEHVQVVTGSLTALAAQAPDVLADALVEGTIPQQLSAVELILRWSTTLRRDTDLEARLLEVEAHLGLNGAPMAIDDEQVSS